MSHTHTHTGLHCSGLVSVHPHVVNMQAAIWGAKFWLLIYQVHLILSWQCSVKGRSIWQRTCCTAAILNREDASIWMVTAAINNIQILLEFMRTCLACKQSISKLLYFDNKTKKPSLRNLIFLFDQILQFNCSTYKKATNLFIQALLVFCWHYRVVLMQTDTQLTRWLWQTHVLCTALMLKYKRKK